MEPPFRRADGTLVVVLNGAGYHVLLDDPLYAALAETLDIEALPLEPVPEPPARTQQDYARALGGHVDGVARERGYSSAASCASYVSSTVAAWSAESAAFVAWRDAVYVEAFATLEAYEGGAPAPTIDGLLAGLPTIAWPTA
jgi:hypothetical protein